MSNEDTKADDACFGKHSKQWRSTADLLAEYLARHPDAVLGPRMRQEIERMLREAEPPGSSAASIRQGYQAAKAEETGDKT